MREKCSKWALAILAFIAISTALVINVFAVDFTLPDDDSGADGGGGGVGRCRPGLDQYGGCYNPTKAFWVKIPAVDDPANGIPDGNHMSFKNLKNRKHYFSYLRSAVSNKEIFNCKNGGGAAYVLVVRMSLSTGWGGLGAGIPLSEAWSHHLDADDSGQPLPAGVEAVSWDDAKNQFEKYKDTYWDKYKQKWEEGWNLTWFCAELTTTTTSTTTTDVPPPPALDCRAELSSDRSSGDTRSRIAVQNMTMDGTQSPTRGDGSPWEWKAKTNRRSGSFIQDSMWTDGSISKGGSPQVATLAKPGDSIRFYHALCFAVRYARRVPDSSYNTWGPSQNHNTIFTLPTQSAYIGATPSAYIFDNKAIVSSVNSQLSSISAYSNLFSDPGLGSNVDDTRSAIDLLQPTDSSQNYNCDSAPTNYDSYGVGYIGGGYQLPGFDTGNCNSASKTGIKNPVGTEITQYHTFRSLKMWERYSHSSGNSCGCNAHGAWRTNNSPIESYKGGSNGYRRTHYCWDEGKTTKDCDKQCLGRRHPIYGYCLIPEEYTKVEYHYGDGKDDYMYSSKYSDHGTQRKEATVYIPYNYNTEVSTQLNAEDIVFQGASINTSFSWRITPRSNPILSDFEYATVTSPNTKTQYVEFLLAPGQRNFSGANFTSSTPCQHYGGINCNIIKTDPVGDQNPEGYYSGSQTRYASFNRTIPDNNEYVGYKYCVAMGIWPADSHDGAGNSLTSQHTKNRGGAMDAGELWNVSNASCRTIAKKPNFQVWNGSVYSEGEVHTSISKKKVDSGMGEFNGSGTKIFGSWADYGLYIGKDNKTMASGAMLGYSGYTLSSPTGKPSGTSVQELSPQTIANNENPTGKSGINANPSYGMNLLRLTSRYKDKAQTFAQSENKTGSQARIFSAKTGMHYVYYNGTLHTKNLGVNYNSFPNSNRVVRNNNNGDININLGDGVNDNTLVIYATGDVVIDSNICLGNSCSGDATKLITYKNGTVTTSAASLPQVLIFADNISIAENVTRVDAWLIANEGTINTCAGHTVNNVVARDANQDYTSYGGNCDKTLVINGPVYAHHLELLRTAGANHGSGSSLSASLTDNDPRYRALGSVRERSDSTRGSSSPAEIFNLRADAYIWAYNQAQRYSEAVVTYMRELAPRY